MAVAGNGCSLEGCHTNIFALTDLAGICWRKYTSDAPYSIVTKQNVLKNPADDPIFRTYSNLSQRNVLCAWRRAVRTADTNTARSSANAAPPDVNQGVELWLFWFENADKQNVTQLGSVPPAPAHIQECVASELREPELGCWDQGVTYEVRTVLFRALHNAIERSLSREYVRLGRWFVQPATGAESQPFAVSFHFFLHGESTVCVACDVRVAAHHFRRAEPADCTAARRDGESNGNGEPSPNRTPSPTCVLAPFGVVARFSGAPVSRHDAEQSRVAKCWQQLLPGLDTAASDGLEFVEVVVRGRRLCYPMAYVLLLDAPHVDESALADANGCAVEPSMRLVDVGSDALVRRALRLGRRARHAVSKHDDIVVKRESDAPTPAVPVPVPVPVPVHVTQLVSTVQRAEQATCACDCKHLACSPVATDADLSDAVPFHKRRRRADDAERRAVQPDADVKVQPEPEPEPEPEDATLVERCNLTRSVAKRRERVTAVHCVAVATQCRLDIAAVAVAADGDGDGDGHTDIDMDAAPPLIVAPYEEEYRDVTCLRDGDESGVCVSSSVLTTTVMARCENVGRLPRLPIAYLDAANERARDSLDDEDQLIVRDVLLAAESTICRPASSVNEPDRQLSDEDDEEDDAGRRQPRNAQTQPSSTRGLRAVAVAAAAAKAASNEAGFGTSLYSSSGSGHVAADQLSRMFPTPPSLDAHVHSPSDTGVHATVEDVSDSTANGFMPPTGYTVTCVAPPAATTATASASTVVLCGTDSQATVASSKRRLDVGLQTDVPVTVTRQRRRECSGKRSDELWSVYRLATHSSPIQFGRFGALSIARRGDYQVSVPTPSGVTYQPAATATYLSNAYSANGVCTKNAYTPQRASFRPAKDGAPLSASAPSLMTPATNSTSFSDPSPSSFAARTPKALQSTGGNVWPLATAGSNNLLGSQSRALTMATDPASNGSCAPLSLHSLVLNLALYDSVLNLFFDRNFDACTICACNMNAKGNCSELELYVLSHQSDTHTDADEAPTAGSFPCSCAFSPVANRHRSLRDRNALFYEDTVDPPGHSRYAHLSVTRAAWHAMLLDGSENRALTLTHPPPVAKESSASASNTGNSTTTVHHLLFTACVPYGLRMLVRQLAGAFASSFATARQFERDQRSCFRVERIKRARLPPASTRINLEKIDASIFAQSLIDAVVNASYTPVCVDAQPVATPLAGLLADASGQSVLSLPATTPARRSKVKEESLKLEDCDSCDRPAESDSVLFDWLFDSPVRPDNTHAVLSCLQSLRPYLQYAVTQSPSASSRPLSETVRRAGPLSWAEFYKLAGGPQSRASTSSEQHDAQPGPQPIPPLLVSSTELRDWVTISPFSVRCWEQLHLQTYTQLAKDVLYLVLVPPSDHCGPVIRHNLDAYFDELNQVYELCRFGKHQPFVLNLPNSAGRHGLYYMPPDSEAENEPDANTNTNTNNDAGADNAFLRFVENFLRSVEPPEMRSLLRAYANTLRVIAQHLVDARNLVQVERAFNESLQVPLTPGYASRPSNAAAGTADGMPFCADGRPLFAPVAPPAPASEPNRPGQGQGQGQAQGQGQGQTATDGQQQSLFDTLRSEMHLDESASGAATSGPGTQPFYPAFPTVTPDGLVHVPALVVYLVDPTSTSTLHTARRQRYLVGLMHVAQYMLAQLRAAHGRGPPSGFASVLHELLRIDNVYFEVLGVEQLLCAAEGELAPVTCEERWRNEARRAAFSLYARVGVGISQVPYGMNQSRTLTGFGPAAAREHALKLLLQRFDRPLGDTLLKDRFSVYSFRGAPDAYSVRVPAVTNDPDAGPCTGLGAPSTCPLDNALPLVRLYSPPFVLGTDRSCQPPSNDPETSLAALTDEPSVVLHCFYTLTLDNRFVLASVTDQFGELLEVQVLNVADRCFVETDAAHPSASSSNSTASVRRYALQRLWEYLLGIATQYAKPIRFTIAKIGRVGHGELRGWASILSRRNLQHTSQILRDSCSSCQLQLNVVSSTPASGLSGAQPSNPSNGAQADTSLTSPCVLSACLISLELDQCVRVLADCVRPGDEPSAAAVCPLSSPPDASCTHILTLPVSATAQPHAANPQDGFGGADTLGGGAGAAAENDDYFIFGNDADAAAFNTDISDMFDDIFGSAGNFHIPGLSGMPSGPTALTTPSHAGPSSHAATAGSNPAFGVNPLGQPGVPHTPTTPGAQADENTVQCLQQPLSVGYYISTAPPGPLPAAFRHAAVNQLQQTPVCFRASLHVHTANGAHASGAAYDDPYLPLPRPAAAAGGRAHPLDSALTCDVLRYVLESYNALSWLTIDPVRSDRRCCLPLTYLSLVNLLKLFDADTDADAD